MTFKELQPGRYPCRITDWSLSEVASLNGALQVTVQLDINVPNYDQPCIGWWSGLIKKKDGTINEKTLKALLSAGFCSTDIYTLQTVGDALDTQKAMEVTIIKDDKGITRADWLNSAGGGALKKEPVTRKKDLVIEGALAQALKTKTSKKVKNYAPKATAESDDEELNF